MVAGSGWRGRLVRAEAPSLWQWATGLLAVLFATQRFAASVFYAQFGVSLEDVGIGIGQSLIEGVVVFVIVVVAFNVLVLIPSAIVLVRAWIDARRSVGRIGAAARSHPRRMLAYVGYGLACLVAVVTLFLLINRVNRWVWIGGAVATFWALMWLAGEVQSPLVDVPEQPAVPAAEIRRRVRRFILAIAALLTLLFALAPSYGAINDARVVKRGSGVSGFPTAVWRAQRAQITWVQQPPPVNDVAAHCLMYLGHSSGVTILFDVTDQVTLHVPTSDIIVTAVPSAASTQAACPAP